MSVGLLVIQFFDLDVDLDLKLYLLLQLLQLGKAETSEESDLVASSPGSLPWDEGSGEGHIYEEDKDKAVQEGKSRL